MGHLIAWPIVQHKSVFVKLETISIESIGMEIDNLHWTKKVSMAMKNIHRSHWGFSLLADNERMN